MAPSTPPTTTTTKIAVIFFGIFWFVAWIRVFVCVCVEPKLCLNKIEWAIPIVRCGSRIWNRMFRAISRANQTYIFRTVCLWVCSMFMRAHFDHRELEYRLESHVCVWVWIKKSVSWAAEFVEILRSPIILICVCVSVSVWVAGRCVRCLCFRFAYAKECITEKTVHRTRFALVLAW